MRMTFLDAGQLKHHVVLEQPVETPDGAGGAMITWTEVASLWAAIEPAGAAMRDLAQQPTETITHRITLRFRNEIASGWRFKKAGRTFRIITIHDPDETGRYQICRTEEEGK